MALRALLLKNLSKIKLCDDPGARYQKKKSNVCLAYVK